MASETEREELEKETEDIISSLPTVKKGLRHEFYCYKGFWFGHYQLEAIISAQLTIKSHPINPPILLCSAPKAGTTWLKALAFATVNRTRFDIDSPDHPLRNQVPHDCVPFLEFDIDSIVSAERDAFRVLSTHMPYSYLPDCLTGSSDSDSDSKIVYIWRDPKDVFVSFWKWMTDKVKPTESTDSGDRRSPVTMEGAFESFCKGTSIGGPYWDHVLGYWKESRKNPKKVYCLRYEDLKHEPTIQLKRMASFLSCPFSPEEEEKGVVEKIVDLCSFDSLKNFEVNKTGEFRRDKHHFVVKNEEFFRKGIVGDWKNVLSEEMGARLDLIMEEKFASYGLKV